MPATEPGAEDLQSIADIDRLVHEPARLMINLSSHMSKLETAGYIDIKKEFVDKIPRTLLHLTEEGRQAFESYRQNMVQVLGSLAGNDS